MSFALATAIAATAGGIAATAAPAPGPTPAAIGPERPGPPILYAPAAKAPQLSNTGIWHAAPILISGASAYRGGEFLYQDYLYDDHGAHLSQDPADPRTRDNDQFSVANGTYTYPTSMPDANDADLVEVRLAPTTAATAIRYTMNTLIDPTRIAISTALGGKAGVRHPMPYGANTVSPADVFVTIHPSGSKVVGSVSNATTGKLLAPATVSVDTVRRQITVRVPHADWAPGTRTQRVAAAVGLWNKAAGTYLVPGASATATQPGGAGTTAKPSAFFNAAFRFHEPLVKFGSATTDQADGNSTWWRDADQGTALAAGDLSSLYAEVDFGKLARKVTANSGVPTHGYLNRILASHFESGQGTNYGSSCYSGTFSCQYTGRLQPYALYVPARKPAKAGYGMTLLLHANAANYNEFLGSKNASEFGDRGTGSVVATPEARDPGSSYIGIAAADVFEVWADVARHYRLDPTWRTIAGYSLGGLGTYKLAEQFPDLFSRAVAIVGSPGTPVSQVPESDELASLRNIPIMVWDVIPADELNPYSQANVLALQKLGYRYDYLQFPGEHLTPSINDEYAPAAAFLGTTRVNPDPARVTYVYGYDTLDGLDRATGDFPSYGVVADHAYWLSGLRLRTIAGTCRAGNTTWGCGASASVDAVSGGFGVADPVASGPQPGAGVLTGGALFPTLPYLEVKQTWAAAPKAARTDSLTITATNVKAMTINVTRARVDCKVALHVTTDGPLAITLAGCGRTLTYGA
jgi:pimeloyl-ACP methyl ester carboxylesterase